VTRSTLAIALNAARFDRSSVAVPAKPERSFGDRFYKPPLASAVKARAISLGDTRSGGREKKGSVTHRSPEISITSAVVMHMEPPIWQQLDLSFQVATLEDARFRHRPRGMMARIARKFSVGSIYVSTAFVPADIFP
jgi:hypothetical protein